MNKLKDKAFLLRLVPVCVAFIFGLIAILTFNAAAGGQTETQAGLTVKAEFVNAYQTIFGGDIDTKVVMMGITMTAPIVGLNASVPGIFAFICVLLALLGVIGECVLLFLGKDKIADYVAYAVAGLFLVGAVLSFFILNGFIAANEATFAGSLEGLYLGAGCIVPAIFSILAGAVTCAWPFVMPKLIKAPHVEEKKEEPADIAIE